MILIRFCVAALAYRANCQTSARPLYQLIIIQWLVAIEKVFFY